MKIKILKIIRLLLAISVLVFPVMRNIVTKGGFDFVLWVYVVELILIISLFFVHKIVRYTESQQEE